MIPVVFSCCNWQLLFLITPNIIAGNLAPSRLQRTVSWCGEYQDYQQEREIHRFVHYLKSALSFLLPGGMLLGGGLLAIEKGYAGSFIGQFGDVLSYTILTIGFLLGLRFHRGRPVFGVLVIFLAERSLHFLGPAGEFSTPHFDTVHLSAAVLLPVNFLFLWLTKERGILNSYGLPLIFCIVFQPLIVAFLLYNYPLVFDYLRKAAVVPPYFLHREVAVIPLLFWVTALIVYLLLSLVGRSPVFRGFFWALLAAALAFFYYTQPAHVSIMFNVAAGIIVLSLLESVYSMAYHDDLTGLPARRSLNSMLQSLGKRYTIAMLDIDFFKKFNDRYGHDVGDQVLCMVASQMSRVGGGGKAFRYGGEEFTIVFPGKTKKQARSHLEKLRLAIAGTKFKIRGKNRPKKAPTTKRKSAQTKTVSVSISIGAAEPGRDSNKPAEVIKAADKALYRAKRKGRNCTVC